MRITAAVALLLLAACGRPDASTPQEVSPRQQPTVTTPGITVTGYANIGVVRGL